MFQGDGHLVVATGVPVAARRNNPSEPDEHSIDIP